MSVVISSSMVLADSQFPFNHARLGIENLLEDAVLTATNQTADFYVENVATGTTYDYWKPGLVNSTLTAQFDGFKEIDYLGIAAHNLGQSLISFQLQHYIDGGWQDTTEAYEPSNFNALATGESSIMLFFNPVFTDRIRIVFSGTLSSQIFSIGIIYAGKAFAFERPFYQGHRPLNLNRTTALVQHITEQGYDVARYVRRKGASTDITINNQTPAFMRSRVAPLIAQRRTKGFFFAWRPDSLPDDVGFCWTRENINPTNNGRRDLMDLSFRVEAI